MDDPALGLDVAMRREFLDAMIELLGEEGRSVLYTSHILSDVERVADRVGILHGGRLVADLPTDELKRSVERRFVRARLPADEWRRRVPGLARIHEGPGGTELVIVAAGPETERALRSIDPDLAEAVPLTLEDVFLELTADDREGAEGLREHLERADVAR
jgi:ABC-2 type transport system ATP-binding protein